LLKTLGVQTDIYQDGMRFIEIDDFHTIFGKGDGRISQYILDGRNHITDRLDLDRFNSKNIICLVHVNTCL
jgi:hypothetical protein